MILIDDFYDPFEWKEINKLKDTLEYHPACQPESNHIDLRLKNYPCYETGYNKRLKDITLKALKKKTQVDIKDVDTEFRKVLTSEINQSPLAHRTEMIKHKDTSYGNYAGVIYFNGLTIKGGTSLFFTEAQVEPDVIFGAKPNRLILYKANTIHCANHDYLYETRIIQTIFSK
jgi:hypothetical protein